MAQSDAQVDPTDALFDMTQSENKPLRRAVICLHNPQQGKPQRIDGTVQTIARCLTGNADHDPSSLTISFEEIQDSTVSLARVAGEAHLSAATMKMVFFPHGGPGEKLQHAFFSAADPVENQTSAGRRAFFSAARIEARAARIIRHTDKILPETDDMQRAKDRLLQELEMRRVAEHISRAQLVCAAIAATEEKEGTENGLTSLLQPRWARARQTLAGYAHALKGAKMDEDQQKFFTQIWPYVKDAPLSKRSPRRSLVMC